MDKITTAAQMAQAVADEIRLKGHYQGNPDEGNIAARSCLLANEAYAHCTGGAWREYLEALATRLGTTRDSGGFADWNDNHPTEEVLAVLDSIAKEHVNA